MISLNSFKNAKGYIVIFTCNHCPYAKGYEQRIIDLHKKFEPQGYPVVAIQPNNPALYEEDSYENMKKRAKEKQYPFVYLIDEEQKIYPRFGATKTPHVFILDSDLQVQYIGTIDDNPQDASRVKTKYVENAIAALKQGKKPDPAETRAIGCGIK